MHILFGPNTQLKLATRKNQDLMKAIAQRMNEEHLTKYLEFLQIQFSDPDIKSFFPEQKKYDDDDMEANDQKESHKKAMV